MGSSQPESDPMLMFGYSVDNSQDNLFDGAPEPAPGAPLLTETDSKFLSSFFQDMTSNHYNMPSFGEGLNFSDAWLDLPPQFMGSSTSYGPQEESAADFGFPHDQHNDLSRLLSSGSSMMPPPPPPPLVPPSTSQAHVQPFHPPQQEQQQQQHSEDVLNAAATLLQNGSRSSSSVAKPRRGSVRGTDHTKTRSQSVYAVGPLQHQPMEEFKEEMWGSKEKTAIAKPAVGEFQWGSDASFTDVQGYVPETTREPAEYMHRNQTNSYLGFLEMKQSAADSRCGSPTNEGRAASSNDDGSVHMKREEDFNAPPRKRRKSKNVQSTPGEEDDDDDDDITSTKSGRKRKTKSERSASGSEPPPDATVAGRRRKSGVAAAKPPRENLSEEQKRENHIRSEQKRRTLIKEGFDDLGVLVPGLRGGGFSKSTTLSLAADWLEQLLQGNKVLAAQAEALKHG